jgi:hypothetical protein
LGPLKHLSLLSILILRFLSLLDNCHENTSMLLFLSFNFFFFKCGHLSFYNWIWIVCYWIKQKHIQW